MTASKRRRPRAKVASKRARVSAAASDAPVTLAQARQVAATRVRAPRAVRARGAPVSVVDVAATRRRLALRARAELRQRIRLYEETWAVMQERGVRGLHATAQEVATAAAPLRILAEGDSWFEYPVPFFGGGLIDRLEKRLGLPILNTAEPGDGVRFMLGVAQRAKLATLLRDARRQGRPFDVLLFSGGGNDVVGDPLCLWVRRWRAGAPPLELVHAERFGAALALVRAGYEDLIDVRDAESPGTRLVFHGYDFARPTGKGVCHLGPWLKPSFDYRGFPDVAAGAAVVREMLLQFARDLAALAHTHPDVTAIASQGTLAQHPDWWHNELHPNAKGFGAFVSLFERELRRLYPGRFP